MSILCHHSDGFPLVSTPRHPTPFLCSDTHLVNVFSQVNSWLCSLLAGRISDFAVLVQPSNRLCLASVLLFFSDTSSHCAAHVGLKLSILQTRANDFLNYREPHRACSSHILMEKKPSRFPEKRFLGHPLQETRATNYKAFEMMSIAP